MVGVGNGGIDLGGLVVDVYGERICMIVLELVVGDFVGGRVFGVLFLDIIWYCFGWMIGELEVVKVGWMILVVLLVFNEEVIIELVIDSIFLLVDGLVDELIVLDFGFIDDIEIWVIVFGVWVVSCE